MIGALCHLVVTTKKKKPPKKHPNYFIHKDWCTTALEAAKYIYKGEKRHANLYFYKIIYNRWPILFQIFLDEKIKNPHRAIDCCDASNDLATSPKNVCCCTYNWVFIKASTKAESPIHFWGEEIAEENACTHTHTHSHSSQWLICCGRWTAWS